MENCYACKQPLKNGKTHKVSDCAEALHRALDRANLQNKAMRDRLEKIAMSEETTRMTGEQILMGYNAHKDLARAGLEETGFQKNRDEPSPKEVEPSRKCNAPWSHGHSEFLG